MFLLFSTVFCISVFVYWYRCWRDSALKGVSTMMNVFPIGHLFWFSGFHFHTVLFHTKLFETLVGWCKLMSKDGMFYIRIFDKNIVFLTSSDSVKDLLGNKDQLAKPDEYEPLKIFSGEGLIATSCKEKWKSDRKFVNQHFSLQTLEKYQLSINSQAATMRGKLLEASVGGSPVCLYRYLISCAVDISIKTVTGYDPKTQSARNNELVHMFERLEELFTATIPNPLARLDVRYFKLFIGKEFQNISKKYRGFFSKIIEKRKAEISTKSDDEPKEINSVMDSFIFQQLINENISDDDIIDQLATLVSAAFSTTAVSVLWTLYYIAYYPEVQRRVQQELESIFGTDIDRDTTTRDMNRMKYLSAVNKESMRISPPGPVIARKLTDDTKINGVVIPKETVVVVVIPEVHLDPKHYENPLEFRPERFFPENAKNINPHAFIPFSFGSRNCLGATFAAKSVLIILSSFLNKFEVKCAQHRDQLPVHWCIIGKPENDVLFQLYPRCLSSQ